jgi:glycosyltransferase involved in cell wall biosynthesis
MSSDYEPCAGYQQEQPKQPMPPGSDHTMENVSASVPRQPISVCHVVSGHVWAGAQVQVATLLKALAARSDLKLQSIVLQEGRLAQELRECGVQVQVVPQYNAPLSRVLSQSAKFLAGQPVQIIHAHGYKESVSAALLAKRCGIPVQVRTFHGARTPFSGLKLKHRAALFLDRLTTKYFVDHNVIVSGGLAESMSRELDPAKVSVIQNGIDVGTISSALSVREAKQRLHIPEDALVVGAAARLEEVKRLDLFLAAAARISRELPGTQFVIAGAGSQEKHLRQLVRNSSLERSVHFLGHRDDVYDVLRAMDLLLITSDQEGIPMALLEAMALEVPVVSRAVGGIPEVIEDGHSGILLPSGDPDALAQACVLALQNDQLRRRLGQAASRVVGSRFSAQANAEQIFRLYCDLVVRVPANHR